MEMGIYILSEATEATRWDTEMQNKISEISREVRDNLTLRAGITEAVTPSAEVHVLSLMREFIRCKFMPQLNAAASTGGWNEVTALITDSLTVVAD